MTVTNLTADQLIHYCRSEIRKTADINSHVALGAAVISTVVFAIFAAFYFAPFAFTATTLFGLGSILASRAVLSIYTESVEDPHIRALRLLHDEEFIEFAVDNNLMHYETIIRAVRTYPFSTKAS